MPHLPHIDSAIHAADGLPATWLRAAVNRGADARSLLQGTGLFQDDWLDPAKRLTPRQLLRLFRNLCDSGLGSDMPLILGARSTSAGASLWSIKSWRHGNRTWIAWEGAHQDLSMHISHAMAFAAYLRNALHEQAGPQAQWSFHFRHSAANDFPDAWAFLGEQLQYSQPANLICIRDANPIRLGDSAPRTFLEGIRNRLDLWPDLTLPACARHLDISPATLKRRLSAHGTTFQRQIDLLKAARAVELATHGDYRLEDAVRALGCGTPSNLRRDMRRLLGVTPDDLHAAFA